MADPIGGGLGKAAQQMMQQVQQQAQQQIDKTGGPQQSGGAQFDKMMTQQVQDPSKVNEAGKVSDVLKTAKLNATDPSTGVKQVEATKETKQMGGVRRLVAGVMDGQNKLDDIIAKASSGKQFSQQQMLAMQAGVYKFSQELELTSKVVEKATSGVKQTMQTQV